MKYLRYEPEQLCAQGQCGSHHKWSRNWYQHPRTLGHHTKDKRFGHYIVESGYFRGIMATNEVSQSLLPK